MSEMKWVLHIPEENNHYAIMRKASSPRCFKLAPTPNQAGSSRWSIIIGWLLISQEKINN